MAHVAGFTVAQDVSARDWQTKRNGKQWLLGKTFDTFCPLGPALVTKDSVAGRSQVLAMCVCPRTESCVRTELHPRDQEWQFSYIQSPPSPGPLPHCFCGGQGLALKGTQLQR